VLVLLVWSDLRAHATGENSAKPQEAEASIIENPGVPVEVDGRPILLVYSPVGGFSPQERPEHIHDRIVSVARRVSIPIESIRAEDRGGWAEILAGDELIMGVTELDARAADRPSSLQLVTEHVQVIRYIVKQYREEHTFRRLVRGGIHTVLATVLFAMSLVTLFWIRRVVRAKLCAPS
jgi:hypothetical protein